MHSNAENELCTFVTWQQCISLLFAIKLPGTETLLPENELHPL